MVDKQHILVVDDHREICDLVQEYLSSEGYGVSIAHDGAEMRRLMAQSPVDLVILDLMLPGEDGLTLARWLRESSRIGIIMLTGRVDVVDRIIGLEMGANYYLPKPFHPRELLAQLMGIEPKCSKASRWPMREGLDALIQLAAYRHSTPGDQKAALDEILWID